MAKLSIIIICWNDRKVIEDCLRSIFSNVTRKDVEVVISDNGSTDGSLELIRNEFPDARILENGANLGFAKGNNAGIRAATGDLVLILNPDTIIHGAALDELIAFAEKHPEAGAFGCRVLNQDGTYQGPARPFPTPLRYWIHALYLWPLGCIFPRLATRYVGWAGQMERRIDWQSGCCLLVRGPLLRSLNGFDERFFYHFEEVDLCRRIWDGGHSIVHCPTAVITHLGGQSVGKFPLRFEIEKYRNRYRYFYKHFGMRGVIRCRRAARTGIWLRRFGYGLLRYIRPSDALSRRLEMYRVTATWNRELDPIQFIEKGDEPNLGYEPLAPAPDMLARAPGLV